MQRKAIPCAVCGLRGHHAFAKARCSATRSSATRAARQPAEAREGTANPLLRSRRSEVVPADTPEEHTASVHTGRGGTAVPEGLPDGDSVATLLPTPRARRTPLLRLPLLRARVSSPGDETASAITRPLAQTARSRTGSDAQPPASSDDTSRVAVSARSSSLPSCERRAARFRTMESLEHMFNEASEREQHAGATKKMHASPHQSFGRIPKQLAACLAVDVPAFELEKHRRDLELQRKRVEGLADRRDTSTTALLACKYPNYGAVRRAQLRPKRM